MVLDQIPTKKIDRNTLIQSYGFIEQLSSNKNFLQESLELATRISGAKMAYISLLDDENQYILSQHGAALKTIPVQNSICQFTIKQNNILVIEDTKENKLTNSLSQVTEENGIGFYAGCPLINDENIKIGALCVMDHEKKSLSTTQQDTLTVLTKQVMNTLNNQRGLIEMIKKINSNFRPAACADLNCLQGELAHLQDEAVAQSKLINEQKIALENVNKKLVNFANMVAHDVRAPLRTINGFIGLHEKALKKSSENYNDEYLGFIKEAATNLDDLTSGLLNYAKSGSNTMVDESLNLSQILRTVKLNLMENICSVNAVIVLPDNDFMVTAKRLQLIQLFQNLISNGLKYQSGQVTPRVIIEAKEIQEVIQISVIDNGIGISPENIKIIFEPFTRLHTSAEYSGSGIGLATCKRIIDDLGSTFHVTSKLGKGSMFRFELPKTIVK